MGDRTKIRYEIDLAEPPTPTELPGVVVRLVSASDHEALAELMLAAYIGTIDYDGEDLDDAMAEVTSFLSAAPSLRHSVIAQICDEVVSAALVAETDDLPLIAYVMTRAGHTSRGLGRLVVDSALELLASDGHQAVELFITDGNTPSERLFRSLGAVRRPEERSA